MSIEMENKQLPSEIPKAKRITISKTDLPPCCLRLHPDDPSILLVGTYDLDKERGNRVGSIEVFKIDGDELIRISSYKTSGAILDMKFSPFQNNILLSSHSTGNIMIWDCQIISGSISLHLVNDEKIFLDTSLITSISFSSVIPNQILCTLTTGESLVLKLTNSTISEPEYLGTNHELECWTGLFGSQGALENVVFTGGDDASLIAHDLRDPSLSLIFKTSRKLHESGVVAILPSTRTHNGIGDWKVSEPYNILTGSYDDHLRTLDLRVIPPNPLIPGIPPVAKTKLNLGGGVWRLIPSPLSNDDRLLACCMYDGARIIDSDMNLTRYFKQDHESMCYGGDWSIDGEFILTCSFYDNVVQVWSPDDLE